MHSDYLRIYDSKPKPSISDILFRKNHIATYNNYISFVKDILSLSFSSEYSQNRFLQLCAINKVIRTLTLDMQHDILETLINKHRPTCDFSYILQTGFLICPKCGKLHNCKLTVKELTPFSLPFDIALYPTVSFPWNTLRLIKTFATIGSVCDVPFLFDESNHRSTLLEPINLLLINNGSHSSTSGIYDTNAVYFPSEYCDISMLYDDIYFDGISFRHRKCHTALDYPKNKSFGIIYEIGRLLHKQNLSLLLLLNHGTTLSPFPDFKRKEDTF